ncbi:MAG: hypothetical protein ACKOXU_09130 [Limnohabitans sp.]
MKVGFTDLDLPKPKSGPQPDLGYAVDFVTEVTLTFPMTHTDTGQTFSAHDITTRTELVLADRFARIVTVDTCLSSL